MEFITVRGAEDALRKEGIVHPQTGTTPSYQQILNALRRGVDAGVVKETNRMTTRGKTHMLIDKEELLRFYREHTDVAFGQLGHPASHKCKFAGVGTCKGRRVPMGHKTWVCQDHLHLAKPEGSIEK